MLYTQDFVLCIPKHSAYWGFLSTLSVRQKFEKRRFYLPSGKAGISVWSKMHWPGQWEEWVRS